jgi:superfamily II DNA/RNA helicase
LVGNSDKQSPSLISHIYCRARDDGEKIEIIKKILDKEIQGNEQCIIFVNRKDETQRYCTELDDRNIKSLSGDVPQLERERIYKSFKEKKL